jgi:hypothetical protein
MDHLAHQKPCLNETGRLAALCAPGCLRLSGVCRRHLAAGEALRRGSHTSIAGPHLGHPVQFEPGCLRGCVEHQVVALGVRRRLRAFADAPCLPFPALQMLVQPEQHVSKVRSLGDFWRVQMAGGVGCLHAVGHWVTSIAHMAGSWMPSRLTRRPCHF